MFFWADSPYYLLYQIPIQAESSAQKGDVEFAQMYRRYAYLTSDALYRQVSAFRQKDPAYPRWLLVQEFEGRLVALQDWERKRKEAKHWWRKNGWRGVKVMYAKPRPV